MRGPGGWWRRQSTPEKVETYTRGSFHFFAVLEFVTIGLTALIPLGGWVGAALLLTAGVHAALCFVTVSRALDWTRGRRPQPVGLLWSLAAVTAAVGATAIGIAERGPDSESVDAAVGGAFGVVVIVGTGIIALGIRERKRVFAVVGAFAAGSGIVAFTRGAPAGESLLASVMVLFGGGLVAFTAIVSVWLLNIVYELDEARETRSRLAVAEERLRFGRDLHDVMGRNLAVIALKSELAVQLAQRDRPEAVAQMVEVQRLAQESQREVREVVRGYRDADLASELAGAQGVLTAAGIDCTVGGATAAGLPVAVQSALGWVVREAATNVLRHGDARRCAVRLRMSEGRVVLSVENDGVSEAAGGPSDSSGSSGSGLAGLRERLAEIDGTLEAGPAGKGLFRLTAEIPLPSESAPSEPIAAVPAVSEVMP
ncbi:putative Nitrate/nitrite sensor protein NarQ [Streptomyces afghaniensis 772]|uniref:Putative Nitrate/nitrite sensor protein NarQ n=1 Tax=Streptomyces afghaniensis 772 TaxID=1283301 RepID=S4MJR3_9ACTN|nr:MULTISPECIES: histidine kinase [Streptomyces]EPJ36826.1 putative Nitrate/nitrite sensor protein NarQ [Streptomyces afghaniensis 772]UOB11850.1 histidine kinase [Streptomyces sp. HP-A2021]